MGYDREYAKEVKFLGNKTVVVLYNKWGNVVGRGYSLCRDGDVYLQSIGEELATMKAEHDMEYRELRDRLGV